MGGFKCFVLLTIELRKWRDSCSLMINFVTDKMMIIVIVCGILIQAATSLAADRCREDQVTLFLLERKVQI